MLRHPLRRAPWFLVVGLVAATVSALLLVSGCADIRQQTGDAWAVTFEVSVDTPTATALTAASAEGAERRGDDPGVQELGAVATSAPADSSSRSVWRHEKIVLAGDRALVTATPPAGVSATCRVLLDDERVIAEEHAVAGAPVRCSVTTPEFDH